MTRATRLNKRLGNTDVSALIAAQAATDMTTYVPKGSGQVTLALRTVPSGASDSCPGLVIDKTIGSTYAQGVGYTYGGTELWASALDYQNSDFVPITCQTPTLRGTSTGDVFRVANTGEGRYGPGIGSPLAQGCQFLIYAGGGAPVNLRLTHRDGTDTPVGLRVDSNGSVNTAELWQMSGAGTRRTAIDLYGNDPAFGFKIVNDPTATQTHGLAIFDKVAGVNRLLFGVHPSIASSDTAAFTSVGPGKVPVTIIGATAQSADLLTLYDPAVANKLLTVRSDGGIDVRGPSAPLRAFAAVGDANSSFAISSLGQLAFGPGGSTAADVTLGRLSAGILGINGMLGIGASATGAVNLDVFPPGTDTNFALRTTSGSNFRITSSNTAATGVTIQTLNAAPVEIKSNGNSGMKIATTGAIGFYGTTPVAKAAHPVTLADVITALTNLGLTS